MNIKCVSICWNLYKIFHASKSFRRFSRKLILVFLRELYTDFIMQIIVYLFSLLNTCKLCANLNSLFTTSIKFSSDGFPTLSYAKWVTRESMFSNYSMLSFLLVHEMHKTLIQFMSSRQIAWKYNKSFNLNIFFTLLLRLIILFWLIYLHIKMYGKSYQQATHLHIKLQERNFLRKFFEVTIWGNSRWI